MRYRATILNVGAATFLAGTIFLSIINYRELSEGEGWGVVAMVGMAGFAVALLIIDLVVQLLFGKRPIPWTVQLIIVLAIVLIVFVALRRC